MIHNRPTCPICGLSDQVEKVSTIYLEGIHWRRPRSKRMEQAVDGAAQLQLDLPPQHLFALSRQLAPPASKARLPVRAVHPDLVILVFTGVLPIFLSGIWRTQPNLVIPAILFLLLFYGLYFFKRRTIRERFQAGQRARQVEQEGIQRAIATWMKLYYCARDAGIFQPGRHDLHPVDEMETYLTQS